MSIEDQIAIKVGLMWGNPKYSPGDLTDAIAEWHRAGLRALKMKRKHACSNCDLTDEERAEVAGYNKAVSDIDAAVSRAVGEGAA